MTKKNTGGKKATSGKGKSDPANTENMRKAALKEVGAHIAKLDAKARAGPRTRHPTRPPPVR